MECVRKVRCDVIVQGRYGYQVLCYTAVCAENYYRQRNTRCTSCPSNSIRLLDEKDEICSCISGYQRHDEANVDDPCLRKYLSLL